MLREDRERFQDLMRDLLVMIGDLNDLEKTFSRVRNETQELYNKLDKGLDNDVS